MQKISLASKLLAARKRERARGPLTVQDFLDLGCSQELAEHAASLPEHHDNAAWSAIAEHSVKLSDAWDIDNDVAYDLCKWLAMKWGCIVSMQRS